MTAPPQSVRVPVCATYCRSHAGVDGSSLGYNHDHKLSFVDGVESSVALVASKCMYCNPLCPPVKKKLDQYVDTWEELGYEQPPDGVLAGGE
jgi:hypothetical protein